MFLSLIELMPAVRAVNLTLEDIPQSGSKASRESKLSKLKEAQSFVVNNADTLVAVVAVLAPGFEMIENIQTNSGEFRLSLNLRNP